MERVYLHDWFYNAGIVGLLRALGGERVSGDELLDFSGRRVEGVRIGENFIEVDRGLFDNFGFKYYKTAALKELELLKNFGLLEFPSAEEIDEEGFKKLRDKLKKLSNYLPSLSLKLPSRIGKKNLEEVRETLKGAVEELEKHIDEIKKVESEKEELFKDLEALARRWLSGGFFPSRGGDARSKIHRSIGIFRKRVEEPLTKGAFPYSLPVPCVLCQEREAKVIRFPSKKGKVENKPILLDTSLSQVTGFSKAAKNFVYLNYKFKEGLPICEVCQAVVACFPLGVVPYGGKNFVFVNNGASISDLFNDNQALREKLSKDSPFLSFFTEKVLQKEKEAAVFSILGISFVELDFQGFPKVRSFNLSREKAELFSKESFVEKLRKLSKAYYSENDHSESLLIEAVRRILLGNMSTEYLFKLFKLYLQRNNRIGLTVRFNPYDLYNLNKAFFEAKQFLEGKMAGVSEDLLSLYNKGKEVRETLTTKGAEKKAEAIAFKLLTALKVGDSHRFMDVLLRICAGLKVEVPKTFVEVMEDKEFFKSCGYSFISGLLGKETGKSGGKND